MPVAVSIENLSKRYRLGTLGMRTATEDFQHWFDAKILRKAMNTNPDIPMGHNNVEGDILWALRDISFEVEEGEVLGIIGRNGAGKSTLLKILSRITAPTSGSIRIRGRLASLLEVGTGFSPELTGRENIYLSGGIHGMNPRDVTRRLDEIIDFAGIEEFIDTPVKRYSSGMYVRLAFAVAAHLETDIMVIDEVLAVGDIGFQKKCLGKVSASARSGRTVLFVSHRMDHISSMCPRSVVLNSGQMTFDGPTYQALGFYYKMFSDGQGTAISQRTDRSGSGEVRILDLWMENDHGDQIATLNTGMPVIFKMTLASDSAHGAKDLTAVIAIFTHNHQFTASISTSESGIPSFNIDSRKAIVSLRIDRLPLNKGQFTINASVRSSIGDFGFFDLVENAMLIDVDYGDFHGIGQSSGGLISIAQRASIDQVQE